MGRWMQLILRWLGIAAIIALAIVVGWAVFAAVTLFIAATATVKLGVLTAGVSAVALLYNNARQQAREIKSRHFVEKRQAYQKFFDFLFEMFSAQRKGTQIDEADMIDRMQVIVKEIMIWGSADTINEYNSFIRNTVDPPSDGDPKIFGTVEKLMRSLRRDLGHDDRKLERLGLTKLLIKGEEHAKLGL